MTTAAVTPNPTDNPFDTPLPSEVQEHQQAATATVASGGNPFDVPLPSEKAEKETVSNYTPGGPTERAMQQTMGGPPMFVDVPQGAGKTFEQAGQSGYQTGGQVGAGLVAGGAGLAGLAEASPLLEAVGEHLKTIKGIIDLGAKIGSGAIGYKEARELYKEFAGKK